MSSAIKRGANDANNKAEKDNFRNSEYQRGTKRRTNEYKQSTFNDFFGTKHSVLGKYEPQNIEIIVNDNPQHAQINRVAFPPPLHEEVIQGECIIVKKVNGIYEDLTVKEWQEFVDSDHSEALKQFNEEIEKELAEAEADDLDDDDDESEGSYGNIDDEDSSEADD